MKKLFGHTELSDVRCSNSKCAMVNGHEGTMGRRLKKNVVERMGGGAKVCYPCSIWLKTGMTLSQQKRARGKKVEEDGTKTMRAGA